MAESEREIVGKTHTHRERDWRKEKLRGRNARVVFFFFFFRTYTPYPLTSTVISDFGVYGFHFISFHSVRAKKYEVMETVPERGRKEEKKKAFITNFLLSRLLMN